MSRLQLALQLIRYFGPGWVLFRLIYGIKRRLGWFKRRFPPYAWADRPLSVWLRNGIPATPAEFAAWRHAHTPSFFFAEVRHPGLGSAQAVEEANRLLDGEWVYFESQRHRLGMPPVWNRNPATGQTVDSSRHWSEISDFATGDIKFIWEPSRFAAVYTLVRAYAISGDRRYGDAFWALVADWAEHNPPQLGPNWKCGQEASFRVMAWCFGLYAFAGLAQPAQIAQLVTLIAAHGERIAGNIAYAQSQNNNHGISEGAGLWTIGLLFPELREAQAWAQHGRRVIETEARKQIYGDGSYAQYSPNYHRVMLQDLVWAMRLGELAGQPLGEDLYARVGTATAFVLGLLDPVSGQAPNHGSNDSALVLPLNDQEATDFRPAVQSAWYLVHRKRLFGMTYEESRWLFGREALDSAPVEPVAPSAIHATIGGYYTLHGEESWLMVRCAQYRARPHHADQLHVDVWWRGLNVCCDAGTYLYNGDDPWRNGLVATAVHNTVVVDQADQMTRYSRFLWLDWSHGFSTRHDSDYWEGWHDGYERLRPGVRHRRAIQRLDDAWLIVDETHSAGAHASTVHWLTPDWPVQIEDQRVELATAAGPYSMYLSGEVQITRSEPDTVHGWRSRYYGTLEPALSLTVVRPSLPVSYSWTILSPKPIGVESLGANGLRVGEHIITWGGKPLISVEEP